MYNYSKQGQGINIEPPAVIDIHRDIDKHFPSSSSSFPRYISPVCLTELHSFIEDVSGEYMNLPTVSKCLLVLGSERSPAEMAIRNPSSLNTRMIPHSNELPIRRCTLT